MKRSLFTLVALLSLAGVAAAAETTSPIKTADWLPLADGKTFNNWKISEPEKNSWTIEDGAFVAKGPRSHLFYMGEHQPLKNFELSVDVKTTSGSNGGIYIHTQYQDVNWPKHGYEIQVNQNHTDWRKSGSIYAVKDIREILVPNDQWYNYHITVKDKTITVKMNDKVVNEFTEEPDRKPGEDFTRILTSGTVALQAHDPESIVHYKNIRVKPLD